MRCNAGQRASRNGFWSCLAVAAKAHDPEAAAAAMQAHLASALQRGAGAFTTVTSQQPINFADVTLPAHSLSLAPAFVESRRAIEQVVGGLEDETC